MNSGLCEFVSREGEFIPDPCPMLFTPTRMLFVPRSITLTAQGPPTTTHPSVSQPSKDRRERGNHALQIVALNRPVRARITVSAEVDTGEHLA